MASELKPCPFCSKAMMLRSALWPSEGDADAIIHADPTDCPMLGFSDGSADGSIIEKWNCSLSNEDDFPSDGSCVRCGSVPRNANGLCNTCLDEDAERLENTRHTPIAPVSPDATDKCGELDSYEYGFPSMHKVDRGGDWCQRSQAEELLAAERAKRHEADLAFQLEYQSHELTKRERDALQADNAALTARIKELEKECDDFCADLNQERKSHESAHNRAEDLKAKLAAAEKDAATWEANFKALNAKYARAALGGKPS